MCKDKKIDAALSHLNGQIFLFKGDSYWKLDLDGKIINEKFLISETFKELPSDLDAAYSFDLNYNFIKGDQVWVYNDEELVAEFPTNLTAFFEKDVSIGAAVQFDQLGVEMLFLSEYR